MKLLVDFLYVAGLCILLLDSMIDITVLCSSPAVVSILSFSLSDVTSYIISFSTRRFCGQLLGLGSLASVFSLARFWLANFQVAWYFILTCWYIDRLQWWLVSFVRPKRQNVWWCLGYIQSVCLATPSGNLILISFPQRYWLTRGYQRCKYG